jgi:hypothetical protein
MLTRFPKRYPEWDPRNWWGMAHGNIDQNDYLPDEQQLFNKLREKYLSIFGREFHREDNADERAIYGDFFSWSNGNQKKPYLVPTDAYFAIEGGDVNGSYFGNTCPIVTFYGKEACRNFLAWRTEQLKRNIFGQSYENSPRMLTAAFFVDAVKKLSRLSDVDLLADEKNPESGLRHLERYIEFADAINNDDFFATTYKAANDVNMQWALENFKKYAKKIMVGINAYRLNKTARDYFKCLTDIIASIQNNIGRCFLHLLADQEISQAAIDYAKADHAEWKNIQNTFAHQIVFHILSPYRLDVIERGNSTYDIAKKSEELIQQYFCENLDDSTRNGLPSELLLAIKKDLATKVDFLQSMRNVVRLILALNGMQNMLEAAIKLAGSEGDRGIYLGTDLIINKLLPAISKHVDTLNIAFESFTDFIWKFSDVTKEARDRQATIKIELGRRRNLSEAKKICSIIQRNLSDAKVHGIDFARQIEIWQSRPHEMLAMLNVAKDSYKKNWSAYQSDLKKLGITFTPISTNWSSMSGVERERLLNVWNSEAPNNLPKISSQDLEDVLEDQNAVLASPANLSINSDFSNKTASPSLSEYLFGDRLIWQICGWLLCLFIIPIFYIVYKIGEYYSKVMKSDHGLVPIKPLPVPVKKSDLPDLLPGSECEKEKREEKSTKEIIVSPLSTAILNYYGPKEELGTYIKNLGWKKYLIEKVSIAEGNAKMAAIFEAARDLANSHVNNIDLSPKVSSFILDPSRLGMLYVILWAMLEAEFENGGKMTAKDAQFFIEICNCFEQNQLRVTKSAERYISQAFDLGKLFRGEINLSGFNQFNFVHELEERCS